VYELAIASPSVSDTIFASNEMSLTHDAEDPWNVSVAILYVPDAMGSIVP
jgi:hypothetical protein